MSHPPRFLRNLFGVSVLRIVSIGALIFAGCVDSSGPGSSYPSPSTGPIPSAPPPHGTPTSAAYPPPAPSPSVVYPVSPPPSSPTVAYPASASPTPAGPAGDHVIFYSEPNFRGDSFIVETGAGVEDLRELPRPGASWSNTISSFRVEGIATVVAYTETNFRGQRLEVSSSLSDLVAERRGAAPEINWDNVISSLRVVAPRVRAFEPSSGYDRRTADNIVQRAYRDLLGRDADPEGLRSYREKLMDRGWSEDDVRDHIRRSNESRAIDPDEVITKAYREVLKRDPDQAGLRHYRDLLVNHGWTIPQLRADLLRSEEWTDQRVRDVITKAYRDILGRDPDPAGFAGYQRAIREKGWNEPQIRDDLARSPEARPANPDEAIAKAYREVLKRDPDAEGLRHYHDLLVNRGWTVQQIRADLVRSDERSDKRIQDVITKAYRDLLGRDPDPVGLAGYQKAMREKGWNEKQVRDDIARSPEARARRAK